MWIERQWRQRKRRERFQREHVFKLWGTVPRLGNMEHSGGNYDWEGAETLNRQHESQR